MEKLTLAFAGTHPAVRSITVYAAAPDTPRIYIAGDSTVTDQEHEPWAAWGEMLPQFVRKADARAKVLLVGLHWGVALTTHARTAVPANCNSPASPVRALVRLGFRKDHRSSTS